eukprot:gene7718-12188_t
MIETSISLKDTFAAQLLENNLFAIFNFERKTKKKYIHKFSTTNEEDSKNWVETIRKIIYKIDKDTTKEIEKRRILFLINPNSGGKIGEKTFKSKVVPFLSVSHIKYDIKKSEKPGHFIDVMNSINIDDYDEFIGVGGDGTLYEIVQGIFRRKDWKVAMKKIIGLIPCGTGNGLCASLGIMNTEEAAFSISKGNFTSLDISSVIQKDNRYYSFLSLTWAIIADVDLGGDEYRWLGPLRVPLTGVKCIVQNKSYDAVLKYVSPNEQIKKDSHIWNSYNIKSNNTYTNDFDKHLNKKEGPNVHYLNECFKDDLNDLKFKQEEITLKNEEDNVEQQEVKKNEEKKNEDNVEQQEEEEIKVIMNEENKQQEELKEEIILDEVKMKKNETNNPHIKYQKYEVSNENSDKNTYTAFIGQNVNSLSTEFKTCKDIHTSDGLWNLLTLKRGLSRLNLMKIMNEMEKGEYSFKEIEMKKVMAFVLDPKSDGSFIAIDGEKVNYEKTLVETHPSLMRIICPPEDF